MAFIMAVQLYYNNKMQEDILSELNRLKQTINSTTDKILIERFEPGALDVISDSLVWTNDFTHEFNVEGGEWIITNKTKIWDDKSPEIISKWRDKVRSLPLPDSLKRKALEDLLVLPEKLNKNKTHVLFNKIIHDSIGSGFEIIEYDLNLPRVEKKIHSFVKK